MAVIGTGSLGKEHARIYAELGAAGKVQFTGVCDLQADLAHKIAQRYRVRVFSSLAEAAAANDALSIVTPTSTHHELATYTLAHGRHVLLEKPMTEVAAQAAELIIPL